jgi:bifunctional DNA-binding transcriptional regulator/antitoxin component of YhaV-PrlF toxin-antitoxin module
MSNDGIVKPIITLDKRARLDFPPAIRDKFDLLNVDYVRITDDGISIIITPLRASDMADRIRQLEEELDRLKSCQCKPKMPEKCPCCGGQV